MKLSLVQVFEKAEMNNKSLQAERLQVEKNGELVKDAKAERLPDVDAGGGYSRISNMPVYENGIFNDPEQAPVIHNSFNLKGEAYLNLYSGKKVSNKVAQEELEQNLSEDRKNLTSTQVKLQAASCYLDLQRNYELKKLISKNIEEQQKRLDQIKELHKNGVVLRSDVLRAELMLSRQKMTLLEIENNITIAGQKLNIIAGLPENISVLPDSLPDPTSVEIKSLDNYLDEAFIHSFGLKISEKEAELSKLQLKSIKANSSPKAGLFAEYSYAYPQILFYPYEDAVYGLGQAGIKVSIPISSVYQNKHKEKAAAIEVRKQMLAHADAEETLRQQVKEAYIKFTEALTRIKVAETSIKQASESFRIVNNTYFNQLALLTDLLDADTQLLQSRFDLANAKINAQLEYYKLQKTIGTL